MRIAEVFRENVAGKVIFVQPLHDYDKRASLRVVQTGLERVFEEVYAVLPLGL